MTSSRAWMTRVGTLIVGRMARTSARNAASSATRAMPGLALMRSTMPSWRVDRTEGNSALVASPLPHAVPAACAQDCQRASWGTDGVNSSPSSGTKRARNSTGSTSRSSHPVKPKYAKVPVRMSACVRSGRVAAKKIDEGPLSLPPNSTAFSKPTASITASISAARSSRVRTRGTGSDTPTPALSNSSTRLNVASRSMNATHSGTVHTNSTWLTNDPTNTRSIGPFPNT